MNTIKLALWLIFLVVAAGCSQVLPARSDLLVKYVNNSSYTNTSVILLPQGAALVHLENHWDTATYIFPVEASSVRRMGGIVQSFIETSKLILPDLDSHESFAVRFDGHESAIASHHFNSPRDIVSGAVGDVIEDMAFVRVALAMQQHRYAEGLAAKGQTMQAARSLDWAAMEIMHWSLDHYSKNGRPIWEPSESYRLNYVGKISGTIRGTRMEDWITNLPDISDEESLKLTRAKWEFWAPGHFHESRIGSLYVVNLDTEFAPYFWSLTAVTVPVAVLEVAQDYERHGWPVLAGI